MTNETTAADARKGLDHRGLDRKALAAKIAADAATPVAPGQVTVNASVTVTFAIE